MFKNYGLIVLISIMALMGCGKGKRYSNQSPKSAQAGAGSVVGEWFQDTAEGQVHLKVIQAEVPIDVALNSIEMGQLTGVIKRHHPEVKGDLVVEAGKVEDTDSRPVYQIESVGDSDYTLVSYVSAKEADLLRNPILVAERKLTLFKPIPYCAHYVWATSNSTEFDFQKDLWSGFRCGLDQDFKHYCYPEHHDPVHDNPTFLNIAHSNKYECDSNGGMAVGSQPVLETDFERLTEVRIDVDPNAAIQKRNQGRSSSGRISYAHYVKIEEQKMSFKMNEMISNH